MFQEPTSYLNSVHPFQSVGMQMISIDRDEQLAQTLTQRKRKKQAVFYAIPTLHNPTGHVWTGREKEQLYEACQASRIPIIEDDVYHELLLKRRHRRLRPWIIVDKFFILAASRKP